MKNSLFSVLPIGGVEEIGSNMTLVRTETEDIIVDCGMLFPYEECFDINYLIPDFHLVDPQRCKTIIITHGHEDHIGALGHLLREFPELTVYCTKFTLHLIRRKLEEQNVRLHFKEFQAGDTLSFNDVTISPVHVNHSIPETCGLIIRTHDLKLGALYISDFKVDLNSQHETPIDFAGIREKLSACKQTAYFLDSTNILNDGKTISENELLADLESLINRSEDRVFITLFASNVHRMTAIAKLAKDAGRKIVMLGRSLKTYMEAAIETGLTDLAHDDIHLPEQVKGQTGKMLVFLSGCQGDFLSALRRFSFGEDGTFKPTEGDVIVFSSKVIPGNEKKIARIYNKLTEAGVSVETANDHLIHASGHPGKEDLKLLLQNFAPTYYFPIHGESYFLKKHVEFLQANYPQISSHLIYNYQEVIFSENSIKIKEHEAREPRLIHGKYLEIEKAQVSQRRKLATQGAVFVTYIKSRGTLLVSNLGLPLLVNENLDKLQERLLHQIEKDLHSRDDAYVRDQLKISTRQFFNHLLGYKPVTEVHIVQ